MKIINHLLKPQTIRFVKSTKHSGPFPGDLPDTIILHYTAGGSAASAVDTFAGDEVQASAHVIVARDGALTQMVPFNTIAWHAGRSVYENRIGLNRYAIGIEMVNAGRLEQSESDYVSWFGRSYPGDEVIRAMHRNEDEPAFWHRYTDRQLSAVYKLCFTLIREYNIRHILGHEEVSPGRKSDPGPAFPLDRMRERLLSGDHSEFTEPEQSLQYARPATVTASMLNIRSGPSADNPTIARPLAKNTRVNIIGESGGWYRVEAPIRGWVHGSYIDKAPPRDR